MHRAYSAAYSLLCCQPSWRHLGIFGAKRQSTLKRQTGVLRECSLDLKLNLNPVLKLPNFDVRDTPLAQFGARHARAYTLTESEEKEKLVAV